MRRSWGRGVPAPVGEDVSCLQAVALSAHARVGRARTAWAECRPPRGARPGGLCSASPSASSEEPPAPGHLPRDMPSTSAAAALRADGRPRTSAATESVREGSNQHVGDMS